MTYDDDHLPADGVVKKDLQDWLKRLRHRESTGIRYYAVGEYGSITARPHYHMLLFNSSVDVSTLTSLWAKGHIMAGNVTPASIHYTTKYMITKGNVPAGKNPGFTIMSRKPGIGYQYLATHADWHRNAKRSYVQQEGFKMAMPRYFKEKIFTQWERKRMAVDAMEQELTAYWDEVERLMQHSADPALYYDERVNQLHDSLTKQVFKNETF